MTGAKLIQVLQDPTVRDGVRAALGLPTESVARALGELTAAQVRTDASIEKLAAAQARTDARLEKLVESTDAGFERLAAAQTRTDASLERLSAAQARTDASLERLSAAQARTDARLEELAQSTDTSIEKLAAAQARTEAEVRELGHELHALARSMDRNVAALRKDIGALSDNVGFGLQELAAIVLPGVLEKEEGVRIDRIARRFLTSAQGEEEVSFSSPKDRAGTSPSSSWAR